LEKRLHKANITPSLEDLLRLEHLVAATGFSLLPKQPVHSVLSGKHASRLRGRGLDFEEVRKYVPGDDIRNIDWRVTARTKITHTKVFTEEKEKPVLTLVDLTAGMFFGSRVYTKSYLACQLAAIAAFKVLKNGDRFGGIIFNHEKADVYFPQRSRKAVLQFLKKLEENCLKLAEKKPNIQVKEKLFEEVLLKAVSLATHDYLILIISDFNELSAISRKHLIQLSRHNDVILGRITDPLEEVLPEGKIVLSDGDLQLLWNNQKQKMGERFANSKKEEWRHFLKEMQKYNISVMELNTIDSIDSQLKTLFKSRLQGNR